MAIEDYEYTIEDDKGYSPTEWGPLWKALDAQEKYDDYKMSTYTIVRRPLPVRFVVSSTGWDGYTEVHGVAKDREVAEDILEYFRNYRSYDEPLEIIETYI